MRFRAEQRLRRQADFQHLRTQGRRHDCGAFLLVYAPHGPLPERATRALATLTHPSPASTPDTEPPAPEAASTGAAPDSTAGTDGASSSSSRDKDNLRRSRPTPSPILVARLGVVASKAAVGNAIERAFAKRRLREVFRQNQVLVPATCDLLLIARRSLNRLEYAEIEQKFVAACRKIFPSARA